MRRPPGWATSWRSPRRCSASCAEAGFRAPAAAKAYHSLIELTVGSAAIDAAVAGLPGDERAATYERWRDDYAALDAAEYPALRAVSPQLYRGTADDRFADALDLMLAGLVARRTT